MPERASTPKWWGFGMRAFPLSVMGKDQLMELDRGHDLKKGVMRRHQMVGVKFCRVGVNLCQCAVSIIILTDRRQK